MGKVHVKRIKLYTSSSYLLAPIYKMYFLHDEIR
jgi:hypothetical protein